MNYKIEPVDVTGFGMADGVYVNEEGEWLGEYMNGEVGLYIDENNAYIPAPTGWRDRILNTAHTKQDEVLEITQLACDLLRLSRDHDECVDDSEIIKLFECGEH